MTNHRLAAKRDANEPDIVEEFELRGCLVQRLSTPGVPDLLVWDPNHAQLILVEVKNPVESNHRKRGKISKVQRDFFKKWTAAPIFVALSRDDVYRILSGFNGTLLTRSKR